MVDDMNEELISSSEEVVTYQNLDIVNCAVATTILTAEENNANESAVFDYTYEAEFYNHQEFPETVVITEEINCKCHKKSFETAKKYADFF